jgi:hypothetical protein
MGKFFWLFRGVIAQQHSLFFRRGSNVSSTAAASSIVNTESGGEESIF